MLELIFAASMAFSATDYSECRVYTAVNSQIESSKTLSCPDLEKAKSLLPKYKPENIVATLKSFSALDGTHSLDFRIFAYKTGFKTTEKKELTYPQEIESYLNGDNFDVLEMYHTIGSYKLSPTPLAIIYRSEDKVYVLYDLKGKDNFPDGKFDEVSCFSEWIPEVVLDVGDRIFNNKFNNPGEKDKTKNLI